MFRSNLHRRITAVVFVAAMVLAGARPVAAEGPAWRKAWDWLGRLWSNVTFLQPAFEATGDCGFEIDPNGKPRPRLCPQTNPIPQGDCGPEIDPDGKCRP
ncbi:MAG TPA: hypothetical protein VNW71_20545 [Thermoanaerobaculia bacterium]|nr:hypothetical protein [Thermoanaerobaculia bacterium]